MSERQREMKQWENGLKTWDLTEESRKANADFLRGYGRDPFTFKVENYQLENEYWRFNEAGNSHGYPATAWLQLGLLYACGIYTAQEQGIIKRGTPFARFWRAHYFDWITFSVRGVKYAWLGGLVAGTVLFGSPDIAFKRMVSKFNYVMFEAEIDINATTTQIIPKM